MSEGRPAQRVTGRTGSAGGLVRRQCGEEPFHPGADLVADRADGFDALADGVFELPVLVALAGEDGAGVAAAHGDDDVG
ncbi:hypothetical protein A6A27_36370 [Micromonospora sp. CB01531]|nr:hypothetical protein A6A27_36370 [Micromonospora sp. CB01531]